LLRAAKEFGIQLEAWAVFSNHYHIVAHVASDLGRLREFLSSVHTETAAAINRVDGQPNRRIWYQFWDTRLTFEKSYLARLHYVHENAVKHRLVAKAVDYSWCSAAWFEREASLTALKTIRSFKIDRVKVEDDCEPVL
jgi:putative transposase